LAIVAPIDRKAEQEMILFSFFFGCGVQRM